MEQRIVQIPRPVRLTKRDLTLVEGACRNVAKRCRQAANDADHDARLNAIQIAARLERIAERMSRLRTT